MLSPQDYVSPVTGRRQRNPLADHIANGGGARHLPQCAALPRLLLFAASRQAELRKLARTQP